MFSLEGRRLLLYHGGLGINIFPIMIDLYPDPNGNQHGSKPIVLGIGIERKNALTPVGLSKTLKDFSNVARKPCLIN
jgi:hypothetical protein